MATEKKPLIQRIKDSDFGQFVSNKVAPLLPKAAELLADSNIPGVSLVGKIGQMISDSKEESHELRALDAEFRKFEMQFQLDLMKIQNDHEIEVLKAEIDVMRIQKENTQDARAMRNEFTKQGKIDWAMTIFMAFVMIIFSYMVWFNSTGNVPEQNRETFRDLISTTRDLIFLIGGFFFGSSLGSRRNQEAMRTIVTKK